MANKYHVNKETGRAGICRATKKGCPLGADTPHFDTKEEAKVYIEKSEANNNDTFKTHTKINKSLSAKNGVMKASAVLTPKKVLLPDKIEYETDFNSIISDATYLDKKVDINIDRDNRTLTIRDLNGDKIDEIPMTVDNNWELYHRTREAFNDGSREWGTFDNGINKVKFNVHYDKNHDGMVLNVDSLEASERKQSDYSSYGGFITPISESTAKEIVNNVVNNTNNFVIDEYSTNTNAYPKNDDDEIYQVYEIHPDDVRKKEITQAFVNQVLAKSGNQLIRNDKERYDELTHDMIEYLQENDYYNRKYYMVKRDGYDNPIGMEFIGEDSHITTDGLIKITEGLHEKTGQGIPLSWWPNNKPNGEYFELDRFSY